MPLFVLLTRHCSNRSVVSALLKEFFILSCLVSFVSLSAYLFQCTFKILCLSKCVLPDVPFGGIIEMCVVFRVPKSSIVSVD